MENSKPIPIEELTLEQLQNLKGSLDNELNTLNNAIDQLDEVVIRYQMNKKSLLSITPENNDNKCLIPITETLYVPAQLTDIQTVTIEIGTGYFVEQTTDKADKYFDRRIKFVKSQIEKLSKEITTKKHNMEQIIWVIQKKYGEQLTQMQQQNK
eukprot:TRINITY_DN6090_c0_g1_i1.p1 TRINITY_DN6090_c0_g1~~TRINITY_DN6090_c0_g1_i1.p1  ORF type:complete len:154 (+),score=47.99 TRINITY_DN6090_c0_g1_i1:14-475(+)